MLIEASLEQRSDELFPAFNAPFFSLRAGLLFAVEKQHERPEEHHIETTQQQKLRWKIVYDIVSNTLNCTCDAIGLLIGHEKHLTDMFGRRVRQADNCARVPAWQE